MSKSKIKWTDLTINPIVGCSKCSPGCENCYAEDLAKRWKAAGVPQYQYVVDANGWTGRTAWAPKAFDRIPKRDPKKIFIGSMTDIFHESVPFEWIDKIMLMIAKYRQHTFQILTKRPKRMKEYFENRPIFGWYGADCKYYKNLWFGVTVCNQEEADRNIPLLLDIPAAIRFVSVEPMLSKMDLWYSCWNGESEPNPLKQLDWVICGGESGNKARPLNPDWVISLRDQCHAANVPFFFKQWGEWGVCHPNSDIKRLKVGTKKAGNKLQGEIYEQFPEVK